MTGISAEEREGLEARILAADLTADPQEFGHLVSAMERIKTFSRLNRLDDNLLDEPAFAFVPSPGGCPDEG